MGGSCNVLSGWELAGAVATDEAGEKLCFSSLEFKVLGVSSRGGNLWCNWIFLPLCRQQDMK